MQTTGQRPTTNIHTHTVNQQKLDHDKYLAINKHIITTRISEQSALSCPSTTKQPKDDCVFFFPDFMDFVRALFGCMVPVGRACRSSGSHHQKQPKTEHKPLRRSQRSSIFHSDSNVQGFKSQIIAIHHSPPPTLCLLPVWYSTSSHESRHLPGWILWRPHRHWMLFLLSRFITRYPIPTIPRTVEWCWWYSQQQQQWQWYHPGWWSQCETTAEKSHQKKEKKNWSEATRTFTCNSND